MFFGKGPRKVVQGRAKRGLFAGKHIKFGDNVSESKARTRRTWKPNVFRKRFFSDILNRELRVKVTSCALRTIDKYGGIDNYLTRVPPVRLGEGLSHVLRAEMMSVLDAQAMARAKLLEQAEQEEQEQEEQELKA